MGWDASDTGAFCDIMYAYVCVRACVRVRVRARVCVCVECIATSL